MSQDTFDTANKDTLTNSRGQRYVDFRQSLRPRYAMAWGEIALGHLGWVAVLGAMLLFEKTNPLYGWVAVPLGSLLVGYIVCALHLFMHEASHYHLAPDRRWNDRLSNLFLGPLFGMETNFYRSVHFVHHRLIGTKHDTERSYFEGPTPRFLLEALTGLRLVRVMVQRNKNIERHYGAGQGSGIVRKNQLLFAVAVGLHVSLLGGLLYSGYVASALAWTLGMGIWFPFFAMFRQILEHRTPEASSAIDYSTTDPGATHRMFGSGPIASTLGAAGFNRHLLHHWDPSVSYTRLRDVETWLEDTPLQADLAKSRTTYLRTFLLLYHR